MSFKTYTKVSLFTPQNNFELREQIKERMQFWFGGVEYPSAMTDAQVFVFCTPEKHVPLFIRSNAQYFFDRQKTEALVFEYDIKADTFVSRSEEWMDAHADY